jgi:hypothetical protein
MSTPDDINISDDEFDAFLKGEGELALMLRQLPQGQPSAQLDDAIMAAAKAELAANPAAPVATVVQPTQQAQAAANDPVIPGKTEAKRSFTNRWRVPLGLAASLFVTVQLVRMEITDERMQPGAPALLVEKEVAPAAPPPPADMAPPAPAVSVKIVPPPGYEPPQGISAKPAAPAPTTTAAIEAAQATAAAASQSEEKRKLKREVRQEKERVTEPALTPPPLATAPAPAMQYAPAPLATPAPASDYAAPLVSARAVAPVVASTPRPVEAPLAAFAPMPAPAPTAAPAPARAVAAPVVADKSEQSVQRVEVTGSTLHRAKSEAEEPTQVAASGDAKQSANTNSDADAQLAKIDGLLKSGSTSEALTAWRKFRRAYPDYKVPDELRAKIDALLNQQTLDGAH